MKHESVVVLLILGGLCAACRLRASHDEVTSVPDEPTRAATRGSAAKPLTFTKSDQVFPSVPTWQISLADLDDDGDLDAVFANSQQIASEVWLNDGGIEGGQAGHFSDSAQTLTTQAHGVDVGDLDRDGDLDLLITRHTTRPTEVYLNDGHGRFRRFEGAFEGTVGYGVILADVDGDANLDVLGEAITETSVYLNDGTGQFRESDVTLPAPVVVGDLDSDADLDALAKQEGVGYTTLTNDGRGVFHRDWTFQDPAAMRLGDLALGDVDGDGDLDGVVTNGHFKTGSHPSIVLINDGAGRFKDSGQRLSPVMNSSVALGDLDLDGDLDLVLTDYMAPNQVWLNDGTGSFEDSGLRFGGGHFYRHAHLGDLDEDGDLDVFLATFGTSEGPNEIWFNQVR